MRSRFTILFFVLVAAQAILLSLFHFHFHEPWRDEVQHLLLSLAQPTLSDLFSALRFEGHPPLLHLLYRTLHLFFEPRVILAVVAGTGYFILAASIFCVFRAAKLAPRTAAGAAWLVSVSYVATYEMGVISRSYGLGFGFALLGVAALIRAESQSRSRAPGLLFFATAVLTSLHSAVLSLCLLFPFFVHWCIKGDRRAIFLAFLTESLPVTLLALLVRHHPDRMPSPVEASVKGIGTKLFHAAQQLENGNHVWQFLQSLNLLIFDFVFPTPWWNVEFSDVLRWIGLRLFWMLLALTVGSLFFYRQRFKQATLLALWLTFSSLCFDFFFRYLFPSSFRHHVFFLFPLFLFMAVHWLSLGVEAGLPLLAGAPVRERVRKGVTVFSLLLLGVLTSFQIAGSALAVGSDYFWYFSQSAIAPALIPNSPKSLVVVDSDFTGTALALWLPQAKLYSRTGGGRPFSYVKWDRKRSELQLTRKALLGRMCDRVKEDPSLSLYYLPVYPSFDAHFPLREIFASSPTVPTAVLDERFRYYSVDCHAPAPKPSPHHASLLDEQTQKAN